jgi:hypothetical protein
MGTPLFSEETLKVSLLKPRAVFLPLAEFFAVFGPCSLERFPPRFQLPTALIVAHERKSSIERESCHPPPAWKQNCGGCASAIPLAKEF